MWQGRPFNSVRSIILVAEKQKMSCSRTSVRGGDYPFWDTGYQGEIAVGIRGKKNQWDTGYYECRGIPDTGRLCIWDTGY